MKVELLVDRSGAFSSELIPLDIDLIRKSVHIRQTVDPNEESIVCVVRGETKVIPG
jgi:hypothetical protein